MLADSVAALGTILAVIVATIAAIATVKTNRAQQTTLELQRRQLMGIRRDEKERLARRVAFWADENETRPANSVQRDRRIVINVMNQSDLPIYPIMAKFITGVFAVDPTTDEKEGYEFLEDEANFPYQAIVLPGTTRRYSTYVPSGWPTHFDPTLEQQATNVADWITFRDGESWTWKRRTNGELKNLRFEIQDEALPWLKPMN